MAVPAEGAVALMIGLVAIAPIGWAARRARGTTMVAPCCWAAASVAVLTAVEACRAWSGAGHEVSWAHARYLAAITSFAPIMSVLGAKRPQDRAWQFIVLSLLIVLALPSAEALVMRRGQPPTSHAARQAFLGILVAMGLFSYLPTRYMPASALFSGGQLSLLAPQWPWSPMADWPRTHQLGCALILGAILAAWLTPRRNVAGDPLEGVIADFRDAYGAVWGLRIIERVNAAANQYAWPIRLTWSGFVRHDGTNATSCEEPIIADETRPAVERVILGLLWRFVSKEWTARISPIADDSPQS